MTTRALSLGFAGLGVMGRPMASHLAAAGHAMTLYDVVPGLASGLAASIGAHAASTPAELAARSDIVVTTLPFGTIVTTMSLRAASSAGVDAACAPIDAASPLARPGTTS